MVILGKARVSKIEQSVNSNALNQQKQRLIDAGVTEIIEDIGSGSNRKLLERLIARVKRGDVTEVIATRIDRISRNLFWMQEFASLCQELNVNLRILDQQIDLNTPHGKLMMNMIGSLAQWEVDMLQDRTKHGWNYLRKNKNAPAVVPFGYDRIDAKYTQNINQYKNTTLTYWQIARELVETFLKVGTLRGTVREMSKKYGVRESKTKKNYFIDFPRESGLKDWLLNPVLRGHIGYFYKDNEKETILIPNNHDPLITNSEYNEIKRLIKFAKKSERKRDGYKIRPLSGLVFCGLCGSTVTYVIGKDGIDRWYCRRRYAPEKICSKARLIKTKILEKSVIDALITRAEYLAQANTITTKTITTKDTPEIIQLKESIDSLLAIPSNPAIANAISNLEAQIEALKLRQIETKESQSVLINEFISICGNRTFWEELTDERKKIYFKRFVDRVVVEQGEVKQVYLNV
jgi:site-specific DNA recombinase